MGRKKPAEAAKGNDKETNEKAEEKPKAGTRDEAPLDDTAPEDPPIVKELKAIDDKYLEIEREYERELSELDRKFDERRMPLLEERHKVLTDTAGAETSAPKCGTPSLKGFWLQAMKNLPALEDQIEEWDEPVLEYLSDIKRTNLDPSDSQKGFRITFDFVENPYFANDVLWKEYYTKESSPYTGEIDTTEIKVSAIDWKPGKNVTVETLKKKVKGGGAKKAKQKAKETAEPRDSFFRNFFRHLKPDMPVPDDVNIGEHQLEESDEEDEDMMELLMEHDYDIGVSIRDSLIPFAVRWYTGEARVDDEYDEEEEEEEEDDDDYDDDDDDEEDEPAPKKKPQPKKKGCGGGSAGGEKRTVQAGNQPKPEECKQQ